MEGNNYCGGGGGGKMIFRPISTLHQNTHQRGFFSDNIKVQQEALWALQVALCGVIDDVIPYSTMQ